MPTQVEIYSLQELLSRLKRGDKFSYLYFWGHQPQPDGSIGATCCSQWFETGFEIGGIRYRTAEHFMMAEKARLFADDENRSLIQAATTPSQAKKLGRKVKGFDQKTWDNHCFDIVVTGNLAKFDQNPSLRAWLISTKPQILVEASPVDPIWGIGLARDDKRAKDPFLWPGKNLLGFALVKVRDQLMQ